MSLENNQETCQNLEETINGKEINNNQNIPEQKDNNEGNEIKTSYEVPENNINQKRNITNKSLDISTLILNRDESQAHNNNVLNQLNNENEQEDNKEKKEENKNPNQSFMQRTKSWMSNIWVNVKNYNYGKYNIFKKVEMEDCLDAHGNHIRIPKNRSKKVLKKKEEDDEDFMKYNNLNYNRYFSSTNSNVFAGYPF